MESYLIAIPLAGVLALIFAAMKSGWVNKQDAGNDTMKTIAKNIQEGAMAFLAAEYKQLSIFVVVVAAVVVADAGGDRSPTSSVAKLLPCPGATPDFGRLTRPFRDCG